MAGANAAVLWCFFFPAMNGTPLFVHKKVLLLVLKAICLSCVYYYSQSFLLCHQWLKATQALVSLQCFLPHLVTRREGGTSVTFFRLVTLHTQDLVVTELSDLLAMVKQVIS